MKHTGRTAVLALSAATLLVSACTKSSSTPSSPTTTTPRASVRTLLGVRTFVGLPVLSAVFFDATISGTGSGTLDANVNWTFGSNDVDIYVTSTACANELMLFLDQCSILARADGSAKPERVSMSVTAGVYRIWVANFGPGSESGTLEVGLTQ